MTDSDGKVRKYSLAKDLGVDMSLIPNLSVQAKPIAKASQSSPLKSNVSANMPRTGLNVAGGSGSRNAEHEINKSSGSDDLDEEWKRRNGYKM